jgi:hypothetical protein
MFDSEIYVKDCEIKETNNQKDFLNNNHILGYISARINIGLYYKNELVSLLTFGKNDNWELLRYTNKIGYFVIGGFNKMLKYFTSNYNGSIFTCVDKRLFDGEIYIKNGFIEQKLNLPKFYYFKNKKRYQNVERVRLMI